ncbi:MAG: ABC-F family ATP-binding cassette domain-containing protein [candidate division WOR-3 bacterium]|nr:ABC-F family ATP-binding cassette domain-containing protein [candidate division WOR-3 bacterium]
MITINNLSFSYGMDKLFDNASTVFENGVNALIGRNGTGKTTLFEMIAGSNESYSGDIAFSGSPVIGYLKQEMDIGEQDILPIDFLLEHLPFYREYNQLLSKIKNDHNPSKKLLGEFSKAEDHFRRKGGYSVKERGLRILSGLGFDDYSGKKMSELSYGYKMRVMLAMILIEDNDILLLDEPTNHLDLPSIRWLEEYISGFKGTAVITSHDRAFLDKMCSYTVEISRKKLFRYKGNYSFYKEKKEQNKKIEEAELSNLMEEAEHLRKFINIWKAKDSKSSQAKSREKKLEKVLTRIEEIEQDKEHISDVHLSMNKARPVKSRRAFDININSKAYNDKKILKDIDVYIAPSDRIFLIGRNGAGKSTLTRIIAGEDSAFEGTVKKNPSLDTLYFDFDYLRNIRDSRTLFDFVGEKEGNINTVSSALGMMNFTENDFRKKLYMLSGGEKVRVYLARLFLEQFNFLILDEPTNYLDIETIDMLVSWLKKLKTGFIIVTHNEYLLESEDNAEIWHIENRTLVREFTNYRNYVRNRETEEESRQDKDFEKKNEKTKSHKRQDLINRRIEINRKLKTVEKNIDSLESQKDELYEKLSSPDIFKRGAEVGRIRTRLNTVEKELEKYYHLWSSLIDEKPDLK